MDDEIIYKVQMIICLCDFEVKNFPCMVVISKM